MIIYRFKLHGSKNLKDLDPLVPLQNRVKHLTWPFMFMHDQEPLDYYLYSEHEILQSILDMVPTREHSQFLPMEFIAEFYKETIKDKNLRSFLTPQNLFEKTWLCHSELNSQDLKKYEQHGFVGVYWWSHAIIARDWFRYAEHDPLLNYHAANVQKDFLIYNRSWAGSREYRLTFAEMLVDNDLVDHCYTRFACREKGKDYRQHAFTNKDLAIQRRDLHEIFQPNTYLPAASADYDNNDYGTTGVEVVLETLFDETKIHLTEKILRPIACAKPFILVSTPGSLDVLKRYGFKTFAPYINESYDLVQKPQQRLQAIVSEMRKISRLPKEEKEKIWTACNAIAKHNQRLFFSQQWHESIMAEFRQNFLAAQDEVNQSMTGRWWRVWQDIQSRHLIRPLPEKIQEQNKWLDQLLKSRGF